MSEQPGSAESSAGSGVEQELLGLLAALRSAVGGYAATHGGAAAGAETHTDSAAAAGDLPTTCGVCPICLGIATLARSRPDLLRHLSDAATSLTAALACLATPAPASGSRPATDHHGGDPGRRPGTGQVPEPDGAPGRPSTQIIDIDD